MATKDNKNLRHCLQGNTTKDKESHARSQSSTLYTQSTEPQLNLIIIYMTLTNLHLYCIHWYTILSSHRSEKRLSSLPENHGKMSVETTQLKLKQEQFQLRV